MTNGQVGIPTNGVGVNTLERTVQMHGEQITFNRQGVILTGIIVAVNNGIATVEHDYGTAFVNLRTEHYVL